MKPVLIVFAMAGLAACAPAVPDSGQAPENGVGFGNYSDYNTYRAQRDAELSGAAPQGSTPTSPNSTVVAAGPSDENATVPSTEPGQEGETTVAINLNNPNISDEQDFEAVSNRQSIQSDAERLRAQREAYQVIEPTAVPRRAGSSGPNIVAFALSTRNDPGEKVYRRTAILAERRHQRNCAKFASPDLAQEAFLAAGGPQRDRQGLDPDGDGFACAWDPRPFRQIQTG